MPKFIRIIVICFLFVACSDEKSERSQQGEVSATPEKSDDIVADFEGNSVTLERIVVSDILRRAYSDINFPLLQYLTVSELKNWQKTQADSFDLPVNFATEEYLPKFVFIPQGRFHLGDSVGFGQDDEKPLLDIKVNRPFAISATEITWRHWQHCIDAKVCKKREIGELDHPVNYVSLEMIENQYLPWLRENTGLNYRLPTEIEWEYAARGGSADDYYWGPTPDYDFANLGTKKCCNGKVFDPDKWFETSPVASFPPNDFGVYDTLGNVAEWVSGCYLSYSQLFETNCDDKEQGVARGGSWYHAGNDIRLSNRSPYRKDEQIAYLGFRLLLELDKLSISTLRMNANRETQ